MGGEPHLHLRVARDGHVLAYVCFAGAFGAGVGLAITLLLEQWPYLLTLVVLATVGGWLRGAGERKARPTYTVMADRVWEARADDGAPLGPEDEEMLPVDPAVRTP